MSNLSINQASKLFKVSRNTVYARIKKGEMTKNSDGTVSAQDMIRLFGNKTDKKAIYKIPYDSVNKIGYYLSDEEKQKFKVSLNVQYSADKEHNLTKIINAKLLALSLSGYSTGELLIENSYIDSWYIRNFSAQLDWITSDVILLRHLSEEF